MRSKVLILIGFILCTSISFADEIRFLNGDVITGRVSTVTKEEVVVQAEMLGELKLNHVKIDTINGEDSASYLAMHFPPSKMAEEESKVEWKKTATIGYTQSGGNTEKSQFNGAIKINRKTHDDEWTAKWTGYYAASNDTTDAKKYTGLLRYANKFGEKDTWYQFTKLEADQDKFSNIRYRVTPSYGLGYWFKDEADYKLMAEGALGYEYTKYQDGTNSKGEIALIPRGYFEKVYFNDLRFSEDITLYPSLEDVGEFRLRSETALINPINDKISWKLSFIDDYDSSPQGATKKNDYRLITGLDINF